MQITDLPGGSTGRCIGTRAVPAALPLVGAEAFNHQFREQAAKLMDIASEGDHLSDQAAAGQGVMVASHDENRFHPPYRPVGQRQLEFMSKV